MPFPELDPRLAEALRDRGYAEPTPVQAAVLAPELADRDLLVSAQTGSGKTVAFGLALGPVVLDPPRDAAGPLALVVAPTRELALQVHRELEWLYAPAGLRVIACVGGMDIRREGRQLAQGATVVVGTPGRLRDHLERGRFEPSALRAVVLDEADEMLDLGFREDLEFILEATPAERRTFMFSATLPREITALAKRYQRDAERVAVSKGDAPHADIEYRAVRIAPNEIEHAVVNLLRFSDSPSALVFCSTREAVRHLHGNLVERGFSVVALSGELSQNERNHAMQALRDGRARACVATDVAARGIDLPDLGLVIHADLPRDKETLLHRSGRTGRAGRKGTSVVLVPVSRARKAERLLESANIDAFWSPPPSPEQIRERDRERFLQELAALGEPLEEDLGTAQALLAEREPLAIAAALVRLHRERLPAPEEVFDGTQAAAPPAARHERGPRLRLPDGAPAEGDGSVWFRMNVGRARNADPRWLIPLICRRGHVTKREIGTIRINDRETRFEIAAEAADRFATAASRPDEQDASVRIERVRGDRPPEAERPARPERRAGGPPPARPPRRAEDFAARPPRRFGGAAGAAGTSAVLRPRRQPS